MKRRREGGFFRKGKERRGGEKNLKIIKREKRGREKRGTDTKPHKFLFIVFTHLLSLPSPSRHRLSLLESRINIIITTVLRRERTRKRRRRERRERERARSFKVRFVNAHQNTHII
jgi:hypothetical protein